MTHGYNLKADLGHEHAGVPVEYPLLLEGVQGSHVLHYTESECMPSPKRVLLLVDCESGQLPLPPKRSKAFQVLVSCTSLNPLK